MESISGVGVVDKVAAVLSALLEAPRSLAELQAVTRMPRATAHRLAVALEQHGLVRRDPDGRFALGLGLVALGHAAGAGFPLADLARPALERLRDETDESVQLFVREVDGRRAIVSLPSPHALRWIVPEGAVLPLDRGSAGRVLVDASSIGTVVESVEEREAGVASASVGICDSSGQIVAAVCISGPVERLTRAPGRRYGTLLLACGSDISRLLAR